MNLYDLIKEKIDNSDFDGLFNADAECACTFDDFCPCGNLCSDCTFSFYVH